MKTISKVDIHILGFILASLFICSSVVHGQNSMPEDIDIGFKFYQTSQLRQFVNYYQGRGRMTMEIGIRRSGQFMKMARTIFKEEEVPEDIAWMAQVKSAWQPSAAGGLWGGVTFKRFGLRRTDYLDESKSFEKSTRVVVRYLKWLSEKYKGNWELAMAAYNCGEGKLDRAIARAGINDFWAAYPYLPSETRNYVPNILAVIIINKDRARYGFGHIEPLPPLQYDVVQMEKNMSLKSIAEMINSTEDIIRLLNPELIKNMTPIDESYPVRIPSLK